MVKQYKKDELEQFLLEFGLTPKQARVYMGSLQLGGAPIQAIASLAKIERTNAYDAVTALIEKGLMSISTVGKKRLFIAEPPTTLKKILARRQEDLKEVLPQFESFYNAATSKPKILYYPGLEGYRRVYEDTLTAQDKKLFGIFSTQDIWEVLGRNTVDEIIEKRVKRGISLQVIRSKERENSNVYPTSQGNLRDVRFSPPGMVFQITTYVYDNKVIMLSSKKEMFGLIIESQDIAQAHRNYFQALWQVSTPN